MPSWEPGKVGRNLEKRLGASIRRHRRALGLTQLQLAERMDIQPETVSRLEAGRHTPSLALLARACEALALELHELCYGLNDELNGEPSAKHLATERLMQYAARRSGPEIDLVLQVGAAVLALVAKTR
jgi:transcriptional regulator with XRE-family HTH domain